MLAGVLAPAAGAVIVDGERRGGGATGGGAGPPGCRSGHAAYMFQQDLLLPWKTALANADVRRRSVAGGTAASRQSAVRDLEERAAGLLREFGLGDACDALPRASSRAACASASRWRARW